MWCQSSFTLFTLLHYYVGDDITSLGEDLLVNLLIVLVKLLVDEELDLFKLRELGAPAQDGVDLKVRVLRAFG